MTEFPYPELQFTTVELRADSPKSVLPTGFRYRARSEPSAPDSLRHRVKFGGPFAAPLDAAGAHNDPDLLTFMRQSDVGWQLIHSAVTFATDPDDPQLETAKVQLDLSAEAGDGAGATAWSMLPQSAATPFETVRGFSIGPELKLAGVGARAGSVDHGETRHGEDVYLRAGGLLTGEPVWNFTRTATVKLDGAHRLVLIARAPTGARARLSVTLAASVKTGQLPGPFKRRIDLHGPPGPTIELEF